MEFYANEGKDVLIQANGKIYARHAITTHFVQAGESYIDLVWSGDFSVKKHQNIPGTARFPLASK